MSDIDIHEFVSDFEDEASDESVEHFVQEEEIHDESEYSIESDNIDDETILVERNQTDFFDKDGIIKWSTIPPRDIMSRSTTENILQTRPGVTSYAVQRVSEIQDSFNLCITPAMKSEIIRFSNLQGNSGFGDFHAIDDIEFDAYLGLLLLIGVYRSYGESLKSLWDESHGRPLLRAAMSLERFCNISRVLAFDDRINRSSVNRGDKLAPIRHFYEKWTENLQLLYVPHENITVDEQLIPFRGRCPFNVYMPSKPAKYGVKAWVAVDFATSFCLQFQIYIGKVGNVTERNQGERVVLDLVSSYRGRNITTDNFFTSHNLALELLKKKITIVGTVRKNKRFLPVHSTAKEIRKLPPYSSIFFSMARKP